jgi:CheY-like chemotaxis protein
MAKKILCVDDSVNLLQVLKKRFELELDGVEVITAENGKEGLELARSEAPDLIFLDINMPGMNGDEVLKELKHPSDLPPGALNTKDIPVIILTSHGPEERSKYIQAGAFDYM